VITVGDALRSGEGVVLLLLIMCTSYGPSSFAARAALLFSRCVLGSGLKSKQACDFSQSRTLDVPAPLYPLGRDFGVEDTSMELTLR
jgi:hypothetical protein